MIYRIVRDGRFAWYWNMVAENGSIVARSTATFTSERGATESARRVARAHGDGIYYIDRPSQPRVVTAVNR